MPSLGTLNNGRYTILKRLSENQMSSTYKARDSASNRVVTIQILKNNAHRKGNWFEFQDRVKQSMKLLHPNIVSVYDFGEEKSERFLVQEFVDGPSLRELMKTCPERRYNVQFALRMGIDICKALQFVHSQGLLHLEIRPENIIIAQDGVGKISELGLETYNSHLNATSSGSIVTSGKVPFGIVEVDNQLLGGIPENSSLVLSSQSCEKRDLLVKKFLETGAENGEPTFFLTIDPRDISNHIKEYQTNFRVFVCNPRADAIIENLSNVTKLRGIDNLTAIDIALASAFRNFTPQQGSRRACIEIISDVLLQHHAVIARHWLAGLLAEFSSRGFVTVGVINPQMHPSEEVQAIVSLFDGEISISEKEMGQNSEETLTIKRIYTKEQMKKELNAIAYLPPEIILGEHTDPRSDLYALGVVLYEALTGKMAFNVDDPTQAILDRIKGNIIPCNRVNPKIPLALANCITRLLDKDPEKRFHSAGALLEELEEIAQKTKDEEEIAPPFLEPQLQYGLAQTTSAREIPLVDRVEEIRRIREAISSASFGRGSLVLINGEAGIGKTRLAKEASVYAQMRGMKVLHGRYPALFTRSGIPPYVLWREVIKEYMVSASSKEIQRAIGVYPAEVVKLVPEVRQKLASVPQSLPISPEHEQYRFFEAVSQLIANISRETPLLIFLEDLQWIDQSSLLLMHYLARGIQNEPLLIIGTYRDTDIDEKHPLSSILMDLNREHLVENIPLKRLSFNETVELAKRVLGRGDLPGGCAQLIYEKTRGNPFFIQEIMKDLQESEKIYYVNGGWATKNISSLEFLQSVRSLVKSRIEGLNDECQNALITASIIGERFTFESLREISKIDESKLLDIMERILKTGLLRENILGGEESYYFVDGVVREVLHEEISHLRRKKLHSAIGSTLEKLYEKNIEDHYGDLAYHFLEGDDETKAFEYFLKAEENAEKTYAHAEAFSYLNQAFAIIKAKTDCVEKAAYITEKMGDLKALSGQSDALMEYWNKSLKIWTQLNSRKGISRLNGKIAHALWENIGNKEEAYKHQQLALKILEDEPESEELASLYEDISRMLWRSGKHSEALPWAEKAFSIAKKLGNPEILARSCGNLGAIDIIEANYDKAINYLEEAAKIAIPNRCTATLRILQNLAVAYGSKGDFSQGFGTIQRGFNLSKEVGDVTWMAWHGFQLAFYYMMMGEIQKSKSVFEEVLALDRKTENLTQVANVIATLGRCYAITGEREKAFNTLTEALGLAKKVDEYQIVGNINLWIGELYMETHDFEKAEKYLNEANNIFERAQDTLAQLSDTIPALAMLYSKTGEMGKAKELVEQVYAHAIVSKSNLEMADAELCKGTFLKEQRNYNEAIQHFDRGLRLYEAIDAKKWWVKKYTDLLNESALTYLARGEKGDRERAYMLFDQTLEMYKKIGSRQKEEEITARKKQLLGIE